jgi:hypothetical protein
MTPAPERSHALVMALFRSLIGLFFLICRCFAISLSSVGLDPLIGWTGSELESFFDPASLFFSALG